MAMVIAHNMVSMFSNRQLGITNKNRNKAMEKLSSGYRINRSGDDAAGLSISEKMRSQIRGLKRSANNVQDGISMCHVAEGALQNVHDILQRMRELSVQACNEAVYTPEDLEKIEDEMKQLKKEINSISRDTEYNKKTLFATDYKIGFSDDLVVASIYDATNGDPKDPDSYGGIIVKNSFNQDLRVPWKDIDSDMVYKDATTGETLFKQGTYTYDTGKCTLTISCEDGSKPPEIKMQFPVNANAQGICIAGDTVPWSEILNEDGDTILNHIGEPGYYSFNYGNAEGGFYIPEFDSLNDIVKGINQANEKYARRYVNVYDGYYSAQAVDIVDTGSSMKVNNSIYNAIKNNDELDAFLKADTTGIWVVDAVGNEIPSSKKTWADLGINDWNKGTDVSSAFTYHYVFQDANYDIQFDFNLLNETSLESVIEGINDARIRDTSVTTNNTTTLDFSGSSFIKGGNIISQNNTLNMDEEAKLGRDFDLQHQTIASESLSYDAANNKFHVDFKDSANQNVVSYTSQYITNTNSVVGKGKMYQNYLNALEVKRQLRGDSTVSTDTLTTVLGTSNVTQDGYLANNVTIDKTQMRTTTYLKNGIYPAATIDFTGLGTLYDLKELLGTGFNSTCKTCDKHYSVLFVYGGTDNVSSEGYGYTMSEDGQLNYTLQVDLKSMMDKGINDGVSFTNALINVLDDSNFDFHYTQYAAKDGKLYVCDDRAQATSAPQAKFDTKPFQIEEGTVTMHMKEDNSPRSFDLQYNYAIKSAASVSVTMMSDSAGQYVSKTGGGYRLFDASNPADTTAQRYSIDVSGTNVDWNQYYKDVMNRIANESKINLDSTDYDYLDYHADENRNSATVSTFDFKIEESNPNWIQSGANSLQGFYMVWDDFNTYSLGISKTTVLDWESATSLLGKVDRAISKISTTRSAFGSYENRMEYAYNYNKNAEENLQDAEARIRDTDMAEELTKLSKENILAQAEEILLSQANQSNQLVTQLLQ